MSKKTKHIDRFEAAVAHHGAGRLQEARRLYEAVLQKEPDHVAAMNNLAILLQGDKGIALLQRALSVAPGYLDALSNLARMLEQAGRLSEAESTRERARQVVAERHRPPPGQDLFTNSTGPGERNPVKRNTKMSASPGHFYSPIPDLDEVKARESAIFSIPRELPGIDLHEDRQLALVQTFADYYAEMPFTEDGSEGNLYQLNNAFFSYSDGLFLYCMMRHLAPRRIIEVGSGWSSALMLDVNRIFFDHRINLEFIEPHPERLLALLEKSGVGIGAGGAVQSGPVLHRQPVQDVPLQTFEQLRENDILFVDSSHVSKVGSDVNRIIFEVLPSLNPGVYVHFHDVFAGFEYKKNWIYGGTNLNESYVLRAFLQYNHAFEIVVFNSFLETFHSQSLAAALPLAMKKGWSGSLWLRRLP
jgi:tetratricopeptide (TPR) repeat protein